MFMYLLISSREFGRKEAVSRPRDSCWTVSVPEPSGQAESGLTRTRILRKCCLSPPPPPGAGGFVLWDLDSPGRPGADGWGAGPLSQAGKLDSVPRATR